MIRDVPLQGGEVYHIFNRGAHKQIVFQETRDYERFILLLYVANNSERLHLGNLLREYPGPSWIKILTELHPDKSLVDLLAYSLMPNHFHLVLRQKSENGISVFMKKVATAYAMYFNTRYEHGGVLFQGRFKSRHVDTEPYFRYIFAYVHLNPLSLFEPGWEEVGVQDLQKAREYVNTYPYSSFCDFVGNSRPQRALLSLEAAPEFLKSQNDLEELLSALAQAQAVDN